VQIERYAVPMLAGRFFGTMALSETQAGSSLADIATRAVPGAEETYRLFGSKMWISAGDHDLSENIVHLVLAKIEGGPAGVRGISLFIVPKYLVNADGTNGERNDVCIGGLNHKMGSRGTVNTVFNLGEGKFRPLGQAGAVGYLVGPPHQGLAAMFHMMNEARIGVGMGAVALGYRGYLESLAYAKTRPQGRRLGAKDPTTPQVPIIEHADVRRMLLAQKAAVEGGLALCLYCARLVDEERTDSTEETRRHASRLLDLLTPVAKAWPSQFCLEANSLAIQVLGGYGYSREYPVEQLYRDNRLNAIHEGTDGIQALDLLGRKVRQEGGAAFHALVDRMRGAAEEALSIANDDMVHLGTVLQSGVAALVETTERLLACADIERSLANAFPYLTVFGHTVVGWLWLEQALAAQRGLDGAGEESFYRGKLAAARYFLDWVLAPTQPTHQLLRRLDSTSLTTRAEWY
jgi:butyryl-CoA dehydrogenase